MKRYWHNTGYFLKFGSFNNMLCDRTTWIGNGQGEAILFGPLWTHLDGHRRDLPHCWSASVFYAFHPFSMLPFLSPPFHQIPSSLMFKIISFLQRLIAGQGEIGGRLWIDWKCVNGSRRVRGQCCCWTKEGHCLFIISTILINKTILINLNSYEKEIIIKMQKLII